MKYEKYLLIKLAEEASEVAQAAIKCSLFGYDSKDPRETNGESNLVKLQKELFDMTAVLLELSQVSNSVNQHSEVNEEQYVQSKRKKLNHYYNIASNQTS
jgi:hypothetical protein